MTGFLVQGQVPRTSVFTHPVQGDAVLHALAMLGPRQGHVSVLAKSDDSDSFAVRNFRLKPDGETHDSGWRCWVAGVFVGVREVLGELVPA